MIRRLFIITLSLSLGCGSSDDDSAAIDLEQVIERGKLVAITGYDANSYFIYKGRPMGYEYELLSMLAEHLGVRLEINVSKNRDELFTLLERGEGDILAANLTITKERAENYDFTDHLITTRQVLIQRKPDKWRQMKLHEIEEHLIRNPIDLVGDTVHVRRRTSYFARLQNLMDEVGGEIHIVEEPPDVSTDKLIRRVSEGGIRYTVADENIALINQAYYSNLDVETPLSFPQRIGWIVRPRAVNLLSAVNEWIREAKRGIDYHAVYQRYYQNRRGFRERLASPSYSFNGGSISGFDDIIKTRATAIGWDWRLLASQIFQESLFDPEAVSWAGAVGLMQLLPETAEAYGAQNVKDPVQNITAGTRYLKWLNEYWADVPDSSERTKFVLASYNVGFGHVEDARRLAIKYESDPNLWSGSVAGFLLRLSTETYYSDEVVRNGYCRGEEPVNYVDEIIERYDHYRNLVGSDLPPELAEKEVRDS